MIKAVSDNVPLTTIFRGIFPFLAALIAAVVLLMIFPEIVTFLPSFATY